MLNALLSWLETLDPTAVHAVNALLLVLEGVGLPAIPFEASMLALGLLGQSGHVRLWEAILIGAIGNTIGNVIGYYLGEPLLRVLPRRLREQSAMTAIERLMRKHGPWMAVVSRWFGPMRTLFILHARSAGLGVLPYAACSFVGALSWTAVWQTGLWIGGTVFLTLWHRYQEYALIVAVPTGLAVWLVLRARAARRARRAAPVETERVPEP
ncbi:DedA family protein [Deinococcus pimensis]|uniref:DedA family protein n=1 Tax=Deinococcus pimensis TaxID=309888 RepID=UPI000488CCB7|nr:VTT domain-containing protein [Deinococcus pimensis]